MDAFQKYKKPRIKAASNKGHFAPTPVVNSLKFACLYCLSHVHMDTKRNNMIRPSEVSEWYDFGNARAALIKPSKIARKKFTHFSLMKSDFFKRY